MSFLEIIACLVSVIGVALTIFRSMWSWVFNFLAYILYGYLFFIYQLYAEVTLQLFFVFMNFYGAYVWFKTKQQKDSIYIEPLALKTAALQLITTIIFGFIFGTLLHQFTNASLPLVDAQLAALSLLATYWTSQKHIATWWLWIAVDCVYVWMFSYKSLYVTAALYAGFVILAVYGGYKWWRVQQIQT